MKIKYTDWTMGMSLAASYTWAAAVLVGFAMLREQGVIPFVVWFVANASAILVFGVVTQKWPGLWKVARMLPFRMIITAILAFIIWFNLTGITWVNELAQEGGLVPDAWAKVIAIATGLVLWAVMAKGGLRWSIITDRFQWFLLAIGISIALIMTLVSGARLNPDIQMGNFNNLRDWFLALWSAPLLWTALFLDGMFWHRAQYIQTMRPYWQAFGLFTFYLCLVAIVAFLDVNPAAMLLVFIVVYFSSQSTMDSCFSGLQLSMGRKWGIVAGFVMVASWLGIAEIGLLDLWGILFGWFPLLFVAMVVVYVLMRKGKIKAPATRTLRAEDALPVLDGRSLTVDPGPRR